MSNNAFRPIIDPATNLQTCVNKTAGDTTAKTALNCEEAEINCHTYAVYFRFGPPDVTVSSANGFYLAAGQKIRWQTSRGANTIAYINATGGENGVISIAPGNAE